MLSAHGTSRLWLQAAVLALAAGLTAADPGPWPVRFSNDTTVGPDGPWNVIKSSIDQLGQEQWLLPALFEISIIINSSSCRSQSANCPDPGPQGMWSGDSTALPPGDVDHSDQFPPSAFADRYNPVGAYMSAVMGLRGQLRYVADNVTLQNSDTGGSVDLNQVAVLVADSLMVTYPGGASYTMNTGLLSLGGISDTYGWAMANGSGVTRQLLLPEAYRQGVIPSISYGLHVGSAAHQVSGSLFWGGFDQARVIGNIIMADSANYRFSLVDVTLGVIEGGNVFTNVAGPLNGLLDARDAVSVTAKIDPGVPYLYLPGQTCSRIAAHLPVTWSDKYGLYLWDSDDVARRMLRSPHYLGFNFYASATSPDTESIQVPLALLNLTLGPSITGGAPLAYFPCRPYEKTVITRPTAILGRAFLQGAFLAQNWRQHTTWLAQAPGPNMSVELAKAIGYDDDVLVGMPKAPTLMETWAGVLKPLPLVKKPPAEGLSGAAKIGIGVGVGVGVFVILLGIAASLLIRRRRARAAPRPGLPGDSPLGNVLNPAEVASPSVPRSTPQQTMSPGSSASNEVQEKDGSPIGEFPSETLRTQNMMYPAELPATRFND